MARESFQQFLTSNPEIQKEFLNRQHQSIL